MVINEGNQGDWQELDPRTADVVREQEEGLLQNIMNISALEVRQLFDGTHNARTMAGRVVTQLDTSTGGITAPGVQGQLQDEIATELETARVQESLRPAGGTVERVQRQTMEFAAAVRRAVPADILARINQGLDLPANALHMPTINIGGTNAISNIDLSHAFWLNRIQDRDELVASLTNVQISELGITHPGIPGNHPLSAAEAGDIADSAVPPTGNYFWQLLLRHNTKTILSDEQVSSLNVEEATQMVMNNAQVRRAIAPPDTNLQETEMNNLVEEKNIVAAIERLQSVDMPNLTTAMPNWAAIQTGITQVDTDISTLAATPGGPMPSIGVPGFTLDPDPATRTTQIAGFNSQLRDKKNELREMDTKLKQYSNVLASAIADIRSVETRKASGSGLEVLIMFPTGTAPVRGEFNATRTPAAIATALQTVLTLRSSASEYDADIESRRVSIAEGGTAEQLTGREAVLKVYETNNRQVSRLDARRSGEAASTRYARNEMNREEHTAREEAVTDLIGQPQRWGEWSTNALHSLGHGRPEDVVCKIAEANGIGASTNGTRILGIGPRKKLMPWNPNSSVSPKWEALPYPNLITAFAALRKVRDDTSSPIHLRNTTYYQNQMRIITNLLATRYAEQVERDFARETESEEQRTERKGQGERNRKQRLIRLLMHGQLPSTYNERADSAIAEAAGRIRVVQRAIGRTAAWTGGAIKNRAKNIFLGEGSAFNPITYPARTVKGVGKGAWAFLNSEI